MIWRLEGSGGSGSKRKAGRGLGEGDEEVGRVIVARVPEGRGGWLDDVAREVNNTIYNLEKEEQLRLITSRCEGGKLGGEEGGVIG